MDARWQIPALWYQSHVLLKMGRKEEAKRALADLLQLKGEYQVEAKQLLDQLLTD